MNSICGRTADILKIIGWVLTVFKVVIPLLIVAYGMFDFGKAVTSGKDDDIKKSAKTLITRAIAGIIIFFVPTIVMFIFKQVTDFNAATNSKVTDFNVCKTCILSPWNDEGSSAEYPCVKVEE